MLDFSKHNAMNTQKILSIIGILCLAAFGFALFSQHVLGMPPCSWCVLQRLILLSIVIICFFSYLIRPIFFKKIIAFLSFFISIIGAMSAWYQYSVASTMLTCDLTLADKIVSKWLALDVMLPSIFGVYATCMQATVSLLGVEYSVWSTIFFVLMALISIVALFKKETREIFL